MPNSVTSIGRNTGVATYVFRNCTSLANVEIPNSVTRLNKNTFYNCSSLTSIEIPNSVTSVADSFIYGCHSLTSVTILATTPPAVDAFTPFTDVQAISAVYVPAESVETYKVAHGWDAFEDVIQAIPT